MPLSLARTPWLAALASLALLSAPNAPAAGVKVSFIEPDKFIDAGDRPMDRENTLTALKAHLSGLGERLLPADLTLDVEVLEVDLAGYNRPTRSGDLRVVRGGADWPRLTLRYSLAKDGQALASGTDKLGDMHYTMNLSTRSYDPLHYEKRMLDDWFRSRFADRIVAAR